MTDVKRHPGLDSSDTVSSIGLRWAALRGMLASPLIDADEQRSLREDLLRELGAIERDLAGVSARNPVEVSAKIDVAKTALRQSGNDADVWIAQLLESVKTDMRQLFETSRPSRAERSSAHIVRSIPGRDTDPGAPQDAPSAPDSAGGGAAG
jgi:hypothetical protein